MFQAVVITSPFHCCFLIVNLCVFVCELEGREGGREGERDWGGGGGGREREREIRRGR